MMPTKAKTPEPEKSPGLLVTPALLKWFAGFVAACFAVFIGWQQVSDVINNHWRLEATQRQKEKEDEAAKKLVDIQIKGTADKAATDLEVHKKAELAARSWVLWNILDFRAGAEMRWAEECKLNKKPAEYCRELERRAEKTRSAAEVQNTKAKSASEER